MIESKLLTTISGFIDGQWINADSGESFAVVNPATSEELARVPNMGAAETNQAIEAAHTSLNQQASSQQRRHWVEAIVDLLHENRHDLANIITLEQGKPLKESIVEVEYSAGFFKFCAENMQALEPRELPERVRNMRWRVHHRPVGVVGLITPWNFPLAMLAKKLAPALASGCAVVVKPAELTPLTSIALWRLLSQLDLPRGRANLVIGQPAPIGNALFAHPAVRLISFTGSTEVGKHLIQNSVAQIKRLSLELGGNAPYIVMADADIELAASSLMANKFRCAGQTCVCANRVLVHKAIEKAFTETVAARVLRLHVGNGLDPQTEIGPLINRAGFEKVDRHVRDAISHGARRLVGSDPTSNDQPWGAFYPPTVLIGATADMMLSKEETFGPVIAITTFETESEAIALANGTPMGLAAYLFTADRAAADRMAAQLHFGHVGLNTGTGPTSEAPFGGMKESGFGREGGIEGLLEFCDVQTVVVP